MMGESSRENLISVYLNQDIYNYQLPFLASGNFISKTRVLSIKQI
jgi:hypothetical protein